MTAFIKQTLVVIAVGVALVALWLAAMAAIFFIVAAPYLFGGWGVVVWFVIACLLVSVQMTLDNMGKGQ